MKGILKRLAKWVVRHGLEELQKELDKERGAGVPPTANPAAPVSGGLDR